MIRTMPTGLPGVLVLEPIVHEDARGWFMESHADADFSHAVGAPIRFVQDNHSCSALGVLRGLHYQLPPADQGKLVRVVRGRSFHVAVDLRRGTPGFGAWTGVELSAASRRQLWVPTGFAHGLLALEDATEVVYKVTAPWSRHHERGVRWDDPTLAIAWPRAGTGPILSAKDANLPGLADAELPPAW